MARRFALVEAAVSCGSPTRGSEGAFDALIQAGLPGLLGLPIGIVLMIGALFVIRSNHPSVS